MNIFGAIMSHKTAMVEPGGLGPLIGHSGDLHASMLCMALVSFAGIVAAVAGLMYLVDRQYRIRRA